MSKDYGYPSFELICKASSGDEMAVKEILKFYDGYISKLCLRPFYHSESGKIIMQVDEELKQYSMLTNTFDSLHHLSVHSCINLERSIFSVCIPLAAEDTASCLSIPDFYLFSNCSLLSL